MIQEDRLAARLLRPVRAIPATFFSYFIVGGIAAVVDIGGFLILTGPLRIFWFWAAMASFLVSVVVNYTLSIRFVFESGIRFRRHHEAALVLAVSTIGLLLNEAALWVMIDFAGWESLPAKLVATAVVFLWNYGARQHFIFRSPG
ncbi:MAG TPA: GtrA family protein [Acetobacteraceae bacterium]|jgi:putative flippase GtrA|nr:GtrA family protein [Acetobacteraceae bacterium]